MPLKTCLKNELGKVKAESEINQYKLESINTETLNFQVPTPQNGQTHSNISSATADELFEFV